MFMMNRNDLIAGRYRVIETMERSWLIKDVNSQTRYVLKRKRDMVDDNVIAWLQNSWFPGIPRIEKTLEFQEHETGYVFEYMPGKTLPESLRVVKAEHRLQTIWQWFREAAEKLAHLQSHEGFQILHLGISPKHLLTNDNGDVSLIDFSQAVQVTASTVDFTSDPQCFDPPFNHEFEAYAAPEHILGRPTSNSDQYALALSMLSLWTSLPPSQCREQKESLVQALPQPLQDVFFSCLEENPQHRFASAKELAAALSARAKITKPKSSMSINLSHKKQKPAASRVTCIWDNAEFGCEMAVQLSRHRTVLLIEADWFDPRTDQLLALGSKGQKRGHSRTSGGLDQALSLAARRDLELDQLKHLTEETGEKHLHVLRPKRDLHHFEQHSQESFLKLVGLARSLFDHVLLLCNGFLYDAFTCLSLISADRILVALRADYLELRRQLRAVTFLKGKDILTRDNLHFVVFGHQPHQDLTMGFVKTLVQRRWGGKISAARQRNAPDSLKKPYAFRVNAQNRREYQALVRRHFLNCEAD